MKKRLLAALLSAAMAMTLLAGCSTPASKTEEGGGDEGGEKVFRYAVNTEPTSLDQTKANCIPDNELQHYIQEGLVRTSGGQISEGIATEWTYDEATLTWTFKLREDAVWSDGEPVKADDFVFGLQRLMDPETGAAYAFIGEYVKNGLAVETGEMAPEELGITAVDDTTLEITLERPCAYFIEMIAASAQYMPVRRDLVEEYGVDFAATAEKNAYCGPFVLESATDGEYVFVKNEDYWNADAIKLDKTIMTYVQNTDTQLAMYEAGDLDYVQVPSAYVADYKDKATVFKNGNKDWCYINHKSDNVVLGNQNFRLALNYALNRNEYIKLAVDDVYDPSNTLVFSGLDCLDGTWADKYQADSYPLEGDQAKAQEYLAKAMEELSIANASDITVEIVTTDNESSKKAAEVLQELWQKALGITMTIRQVTYSEIYGSVLPGDDWEISATGGWGADYPDAYSYLELFKSDCAYNYSKCENAQIDEYLNASLTETDAEARMDLLGQAEQAIIDYGAFVPLQERNVWYMLDEDVTGIEFYYCSINLDWVYADITE
ncbi:MAG: peptide ABC transporter substrate-binding protein [Bariatricus sp.]